MRGVESGVKEKVAESQNEAEDGNESQETKYADALAAEFRETQGLGFEFLIEHRVGRSS